MRLANADGARVRAHVCYDWAMSKRRKLVDEATRKSESISVSPNEWAAVSAVYRNLSDRGLTDARSERLWARDALLAHAVAYLERLSVEEQRHEALKRYRWWSGEAVASGQSPETAGREAARWLSEYQSLEAEYSDTTAWDRLRGEFEYDHSYRAQRMMFLLSKYGEKQSGKRAK